MYLIVDEEGTIHKTSKIVTIDIQMADDGLLDIIKVTTNPLNSEIKLQRYHKNQWENIEEWEAQ